MGTATCTVVLGMLFSILSLKDATGMTNAGHGFCQNDVLEASCASDEVVMMEASLFGRMELGGCIRKDYGFIGCKADVLNITDRMCSGRRSCSLRVPNELLDATYPCPEDFKNYLWANYTCAKVVTPNTKTCYQPMELDAPEGNLASVVAMETECGSPKAPWLLEVKQGQRINITLVDFSYSLDGDASNLATSKCVAYATISEGAYKRTVTVCGRHKRLSHEYLSVSNKVKVILLGTHSENGRHFILSYKAIGCADIMVNPGGWIKREDNHVTMGCEGSRKEWEITCQDGLWAGERPNCTRGGAAMGSKQGGSIRLPYDIAIVMVAAIAGGIAMIILCIGLLCVRRARGTRSVPNTQQMAPQYGAQDFTSQEDGNYTRKERDLTWNYEHYKMSENEYASIQERSSPPPVGNRTPAMFAEHAHTHAHSKQLPDFRSQSPAPPYSCLEPASENSMNQYTESNSGGSRQYYVLDTMVVNPEPQ